MAGGDLTLFFGGDAMVARPWSGITEPAFIQLVEEIRASDVSIANLETVIHDFNGYAQHDSGGAYIASPTVIAGELKWAGFDMLAHANNHAFDYGSQGILDTVTHVENAGLVLAGSGADLQSARAPRYVHRKNAVVGVVAMAANFISYGRASHARADMPGRPGLNPLSTTRRERALIVPPRIAARLRDLGRSLGCAPRKLEGRAFKVGLHFHVGRRFGFERAHELSEKDRTANLEAISEAARNADIVVASIHAHWQGRWLREFSMDAIEHGADVVFIHGPHEIRGIELYRDKPIFYSLGNFAFEIESVEKFPAEAYERAGLNESASPTELKATTRKSESSFLGRRTAFEGAAAVVTIEKGRVSRIRLIPLDLQFDGDERDRGRPRIASPALGRQIIATIATRSEKYGLQNVSYDPAANCGYVLVQ